ncbi:MAG: UDP-N-acetylmuramoyl-tripeptide--D-alanyl-D-alanine ligase [Chlamydiota bacterium]
MLLANLKKIAALNGQPLESLREMTRVAIDSRQVKPKTLFFALPGKKVDGHEFLAQVKARGGVAAVVAKEYRGPTYGLALLPVQDVKQVLHTLAKAVHEQRKQPVIGVTGTVGKTTVKEFIVTLLEERLCVGKTPGNANSQLGLPVALINDPGQAEVFVLEMGMSFPTEISRLVEIAPPDIGVLTQVSLVHAENFRSLEEIAAAKCELFASPRLKRGFFCAPTLAFRPVQELTCDKVIYSYRPSAESDYFFDVVAETITICERGKKSPQLQMPIRASHLLENALAAVSVARHFGLTWGEIDRGLKKLRPYHHRFETIERSGVLYIDDSYNASPHAVKAALSNLPKSSGKTIAVLGAMKELGAFCEASHREIGIWAVDFVDCALCLGKECQPLVRAFRASGKPAFLFTQLSELKKSLDELASAGDVVLIKGSCSLKMWTLLDAPIRGIH